MDVPFRQLKRSDVLWAADSQRERIQATSRRALQYLTDPEKKVRREKQLCVCCFYGDHIGGAAMTRAHCSLCKNEMMFGSTYVDKLCPECAKAHALCKHCTGGVDLKISRNLNLPEVPK